MAVARKSSLEPVLLSAPARRAATHLPARPARPARRSVPSHHIRGELMISRPPAQRAPARRALCAIAMLSALAGCSKADEQSATNGTLSGGAGPSSSAASSASVKPSASAAPTVAAAYNALASTLHDCHRQNDACRDATDCSEHTLAPCDDELQACEVAARADEDALHEAAYACRTARELCEDAITVDGDDACEAREVCHQQEHECMKPNMPPEPPCHAALEACLQTARETDAANGGADTDAAVRPRPAHACPPAPPPPSPKADHPAPPLPPPADAGHPAPPPPPPEAGHAPPPPPARPGAPPAPRRPESDAERACHEAAHACMKTEMDAARPTPPKCGPTPPPPPPDRDEDGGVAPPHPRKPPPPPAAGEPHPPRPPGAGAPPPPSAAGTGSDAG